MNPSSEAVLDDFLNPFYEELDRRGFFSLADVERFLFEHMLVQPLPPGNPGEVVSDGKVVFRTGNAVLLSLIGELIGEDGPGNVSLRQDNRGAWGLAMGLPQPVAQEVSPVEPVRPRPPLEEDEEEEEEEDSGDHEPEPPPSRRMKGRFRERRRPANRGGFRCGACGDRFATLAELAEHKARGRTNPESTRPLPVDRTHQLLMALKELPEDDIGRRLVELTAYTGGHPSVWSDPRGHGVTVQGDGQIAWRRPKTGAHVFVPVTPEMRPWVAQFLKVLEQKRYTRFHINRMIRKTCALVGFPGVTPRTLRHSFGLRTWARTRDIRVVQAWLGTKSTETALRYINADLSAEKTDLIEKGWGES